jgi:hypothetical protein
MPETNGEIPLTGDPKVDSALKRIWGKFKDLEDAVIVQSFLEKQAGERIREHAEWIARHDEAIAKHDASIAEYEERMKRIEINVAEMSEKANFLFDREMRRHTRS